MNYASAQQFAKKYGIDETAQLLQDEEKLIDADLLRAALAGALDPVEWSAEQIAAGVAALERLDDALGEASRTIDGYLLAQYSLPLTVEQVAATPLTARCLTLARCVLMDDPDNRTDLATDECKAAIAWLRDVADGRVQLLPSDQGGNSGKTVIGRFGSRYPWGSYP